MLMVVQAVVTETISNLAQRATLVSGIGSLAMIEELRTSPDHQFVDLQEIARKQLASFEDRVSMQGPPLPLDSIYTKVAVLI